MSVKNKGFIFADLLLKVVLFFIFLAVAKAIFIGIVGSLFGSIAGNSNKLTVDTRRPGIVVGYFNGVGCTPKIAANSKYLLRQQFGTKNQSGQLLQYQLFYNDSYGYFADIMEVFEQRVGTADAGSWEFFLDFATGNAAAATASSAAAKALWNVLESPFNTAAADHLRAMQKARVAKNNAEQTDLIAKLTAKKSNQRLVFVAHSQGNLFATPAYDLAAKRRKDTTVVHAAPPSTALRGDYVLSSRDLIINTLRLGGPAPAANIDPPPGNYADALGHGFAEIYFNPQHPAGKRVIELADTVINGKR